MKYIFKLEMEFDEEKISEESVLDISDIYDLIVEQLEGVTKLDVSLEQNTVIVTSNDDSENTFVAFVIRIGKLFLDEYIQPFVKEATWYNKRCDKDYCEDMMKEASIYFNASCLSSEKGSRRMLDFSFDKKRLKTYYQKKNYKDAYTEIGDFLISHGFESYGENTYMSKEKLSDTMVGLLIAQIMEDYTWFSVCISKMLFSNIGKTKSLMPFFKGEQSLDDILDDLDDDE